MIWGAISGDGAGPIHRFDNVANQNGYKALLEANKHYLKNRMLAQDNAPCHKARTITTWLRDEGIETLNWPSCSPDLNPIEHVWASIKRKLQGRHFLTKNLLWTELKQQWQSFSQAEVLKYIDSMPSRIEAVIASKGKVSKY